MTLSWEEIEANAVAFAARWAEAANKEAQAFCIDFLRVFGVERPGAIRGF